MLSLLEVGSNGYGELTVMVGPPSARDLETGCVVPDGVGAVDGAGPAADVAVRAACDAVAASWPPDQVTLAELPLSRAGMMDGPPPLAALAPRVGLLLAPRSASCPPPRVGLSGIAWG